MAAIVTIFGGTGFLGRALAAELLEQGCNVRIAARHPGGIPAATSQARVEYVRADVRDEQSVAHALAGARSAINAVGLYVENRDQTFAAVHVQGAANVAKQAAKAGLETVVHVSGIGADGSSPSDYVRARAEGERVAAAAFSGSVIVRPSVLFGPGDAFLNTIDSITRVAPVYPLFGRGDTRLQPVYAGDVAEGIRRILKDPSRVPRCFEFGGPDVLRYREVVDMVLRFRRRKRMLLPVPFAAWSLLAGGSSLLPNPPLTQDQVILMRDHNVVAEGAAAFADLGVRPSALAALLPRCLPSPPA